MAVNGTMTATPQEEAALAQIAAETLRTTGVTVRFRRADGSALEAAPHEPSDAATERLAA